MSLPKSLTKLVGHWLRPAVSTGVLGIGTALGSLALCSTGCGGCDQPVLSCHDGECQYCNPYGYDQATPFPGGYGGSGVTSFTA